MHLGPNKPTTPNTPTLAAGPGDIMVFVRELTNRLFGRASSQIVLLGTGHWVRWSLCAFLRPAPLIPASFLR